MNPLHLKHFYITRSRISVPDCSGNPELWGVQMWWHGGVSQLWPQSPVHGCCGVKGRALQGLFPPWAVGGTQDSPDPRCQPAAGISWQKGGTEQGLFTCPLSAPDTPAKEIIVLKERVFLLSVCLLSCPLTIPECSGHDSPLNCLSLSCLARAPQHPQQLLSCSAAGTVILQWAVICWDLVKPFSSGGVRDWVLLQLLYSL